MQGFINFILANKTQAKHLRDKFQFKIVPMMNVDGVISGNYRCNISGTDINRQWQFPSKRFHPQVYWLKQQISSNKKRVAFFLDIHGHSRKMNSFFYGTKISKKCAGIYPFICSKLNKFISYHMSSFSDDPSKKTTARVVVQNQLLIPMSLTFQASLYGWIDQEKKINHSFKINDLRNIGQTLAVGMYYTLIGVQNIKKCQTNIRNHNISQKDKQLHDNSLKMLNKWSKQLQKQKNQSDDLSQGSSLDPQHFQLRQSQIQAIQSVNLLKKQHKQRRQISTPKKQEKISQQHTQNRKLKLYESLHKTSNNQSKLLTPKSQISQNFGLSTNQFHRVTSFKQTKQGKSDFSVSQLQLQLQGCNPSSYLIKDRNRKINLSTIDQTQPFDIDRGRNYRKDVLQMKKALKYLLQTKSSDYDRYKSCFKTISNDLNYRLQKPTRYNP